jgi:PAS domain S-box-containing protein
MLLVVIIGFVAIFIYSNIHMKNKIVFKAVENTEMISNLIFGSTIDALSGEHNVKAYERILDYGNIIGVNEVGIFNLNGDEAFQDLLFLQGIDSHAYMDRSIMPDERINFNKAIVTLNRVDFFDHKKMVYFSYLPIISEDTCHKCHMEEGQLLGILKVKLSTENDFSLLGLVQKFIWGLGFIVVLLIIGLIVTGFIIHETNTLNVELQMSNEEIHKTHDVLTKTMSYLQTILDNSKAQIVTTDLEGRIVEFNKEAENILGYSKKEVVGESILKLYANPDRRAELLNTRQITGSDSWVARNREVELKSKSGKTVPVNLTLSAMLDENLVKIGTVGIGKDMSEQRLLQHKLLQAEKLAGIGTLASGIAHEINNPLAGILGMAEAVRDEDDIKLIKSYTSDIIGYAIKASDIVKDLNVYSRAVHNESKSTVDLSHVMESSLKMAKHSASFISIEVIEDLSESCYMLANEGEIQQVLVNLMVNAIHGMDQKGTLKLKCSKSGDFVHATISDSGKGISKEHLDQIYDPFFTTKPVGEGTGLGLYVAYKIVTKLGGTISCESEEGLGTTFSLRFPACNMEVVA